MEVLRWLTVLVSVILHGKCQNSNQCSKTVNMYNIAGTIYTDANATQFPTYNGQDIHNGTRLRMECTQNYSLPDFFAAELTNWIMIRVDGRRWVYEFHDRDIVTEIQPSCIEVKGCSIPYDTNTKYTKDGYVITRVNNLQSVQVACVSSNYEVSPGVERGVVTCLSGQLSNVVSCKPKSCKIEPLPRTIFTNEKHYQITAPIWLPHDSAVSVSCNDGYEKEEGSNERIIICEYGKWVTKNGEMVTKNGQWVTDNVNVQSFCWTDTSFMYDITGTVYTDENGERFPLYHGQEVTSGKVLTMTCTKGYRLPIVNRGEDSLPIKANGCTWSYEHNNTDIVTDVQPSCEQANITCYQGEFQCGMSLCIPESWCCDGMADCLGAEDEQNCVQTTEAYNCTNDEFRCDSGQCIKQQWRCDRHTDCGDNSDEKDCDFTCADDTFSCGNGTCIDKQWVCDGENDCSDESDEKDCIQTTCPGDQFQCGSGECISAAWVCDGTGDCTDLSDEKNCTTTCADDEFECLTSEACISKQWICDGDFDCTDHSDEENCGPKTCPSNNFLCDNTTCIVRNWLCDGEHDCKDESDEANCTSTTNEPKCWNNEFACDNHDCIHENWRCDGEIDCSDASDEADCPSTTETSMCAGGYELDTDGINCRDKDECQKYRTCSQECINTDGSYVCHCQEGYVENGRLCTANGDEPKLWFSSRVGLREIGIRSHTHHPVIGGEKYVAFDYDIKENVVYMSQISRGKIYKSTTNNLGTTLNNVTIGVGTVDGIAFDWVHRNLYWTDTARNTIEVRAEYTGVRRVVFNTGLDEPRAIVVDPRKEHGWMYWTDWGATPCVCKAGLDGSHRSTIISQNIHWPNGLTIDYSINRLFLIDAKLNIILSAQLDGTNLRTILADQQRIGHPFSITVFEDWVYWTDWDTNSIYKADKFGRNDNETAHVATSLNNAFDIKVVHRLRQPEAPNRCGNNNGGCSHICLPSPQTDASSPGYICACPSGLNLDTIGKLCTGYLK